MKPRVAGTRRALPGSPFNKPPAVVAAVRYSLGDRVTHDRHGLGTVVGTEEGDVAVLVDFRSKVVRVTLPNTKLVKL